MHAWPMTDSAAVRRLAPDAVAAFDQVLGAIGTAGDPARLELARRRVATLLQLPTDQLPALATPPAEQIAALPSWPTSPVFDPIDRVTLGFSEQFVIDVAAVSAADRKELTDAFGAESFGFVQALFVLDHGSRLVAGTEQLFGTSPFRVATQPSGASLSRPLWPALEAMMAAVVTLDALDPLTAELVRLRGARFHQCRLCQSRRRVAAVAANAAVLEDPDPLHGGDLNDLARSALQLVDAILLSPGLLPTPVMAAVRRHLTPRQALNVLLLVAHNAANKIAVAFGADAPAVTSGVEYFEIDGAGGYEYGLAAPA